MAILGAHMSITGGFHKAVERAEALGFDCVQIFTAAPQQWPVLPAPGEPPLPVEAARRFHEALERGTVRYPLSHTSYLINLAAADDTLWERSTAALTLELRRADQLRVPYVVLHPGAHTTLTEREGLDRVVLALDRVHNETSGLSSQVLLESTAGQGTCLGWKFEQLAYILNEVRDTNRLGVCLDTCHLHAAGYDMTTRPKYLAMWREFESSIGIARLHALHLNDSKRELGSRVDRHENIGRGSLGIEPFRWLLNDRRLRKIPMYLETPKSKDDHGEEWDVVNLRTLRALSEGK
ncbi:MAG: deoxyribonuclease IV [Planctomycetales bacterium]|nr:deoxyribonuclease IV [Planctomycetales bacterium]